MYKINTKKTFKIFQVQQIMSEVYKFAVNWTQKIGLTDKTGGQ